MNRKENFFAGFIRENPVFGLYLGLCSTLAITTNLNNAIGMGLCVIVILIASNCIISAIRKIVPDEIRIPVFIVVIATLVKITALLLQAYVPSLYSAIGIYIDLIVVNCIILGRAEAFASKNGIADSALDGLGMGLGYTFALLAMSIIRQILGTGVLSFTNPLTDAVVFSIKIIPETFTINLFTTCVGGFLTFSVLAAALAAYKNNLAAKAEAARKAEEAAKKAAALEAKKAAAAKEAK